MWDSAPIPLGGGWLEVFDDAGADFAHVCWKRVPWPSYNNANGETRPACGELDGDGKDEIVVGLGKGGGGWVELLEDAAEKCAHLDWLRVEWKDYNCGNGEARPALGDLDRDGKDEVLLGLGGEASGWFEVKDDLQAGCSTLKWLRIR